MSTGRSRSALLWIGGTLLVSFAIFRQFESIAAEARIRFAEEQTEIFEQMREQVEVSDATNAAGCLSYTLNYYPSGTKQVAGSPLDYMVERARRGALREMMARLRTKTGQDFGDDPQRWIEGLKASRAR
jgi:hypothetical protein